MLISLTHLSPPSPSSLPSPIVALVVAGVVALILFIQSTAHRRRMEEYVAAQHKLGRVRSDHWRALMDVAMWEDEHTADARCDLDDRAAGATHRWRALVLIESRRARVGGWTADARGAGSGSLGAREVEEQRQERRGLGQLARCADGCTLVPVR